MCIICEQYKDGRLTFREAIKNYEEMRETLSEEHQKEIEEKLFNNFPYYPVILNHIFDDEYWEKLGFGD